jgi:hypothetical protein
MDIKRKTCDIRTWKKHLFLDISSTNIDTRVPSLYQCFEIRSIEVFLLLSQPLPHLVGHHLRHSNVLERIFRPSYEPLYATNTSQCKQQKFFVNILCIKTFCPQKRTTECCPSVVHSTSTVAILTTKICFWICASASAT